MDIFNKHNNVKPCIELLFSPGNLVLFRDLEPTPGLSKKLSAQYHGYAILAKLSNVNYELKIADHGAKQTTIVHVANLHRYIPRRPVHFLSNMSPGTNHIMLMTNCLSVLLF